MICYSRIKIYILILISVDIFILNLFFEKMTIILCRKIRTKIYVKFVSHPTGPIIKEDISVSYSKVKITLLYFIKRQDKFF
jgi:hypothetical protein